MPQTRHFRSDTFAGAEELFHWDDVDEAFTIERIEDIEPLIEQNKALANEDTGRFGELNRVASIPMSIYMELKEKGIVDDQKAFRRWLNDRDNLVFRTRHGQI